MSSSEVPSVDGALMEAEIASQPECWAKAVELVSSIQLPTKGQRVSVIGCGTSYFMAQAYARLRENAGEGVTDAWLPTEAPDRDYDVVVAISRSGTTTEVLDYLSQIPAGVRTIGIVADTGSPLPAKVDEAVILDFADEQSVVQTRFATTALSVLRAGLGVDLSQAIADCRSVLEAELPADAVDAEQISFLGQGWTIGLAEEAGLKNREASQSWTEAYPAMDYRHGPISIAAPGRVVWCFGEAPEGLDKDVAVTGASFRNATDLDPLADLVLAQRVALQRARNQGLNADQPRSLTRSVILS